MTEYRQYGLARQEAACIKPGHWVVDGNDIQRSQIHGGAWVISFCGKRVGGLFGSLRSAREFLYKETYE